jgi:hypothetical protein
MVCRSLDVSRPKEKGDGFLEDRRSLEHLVDRRQPPLASDDSIPTYSQIVAGLWLKYGAKSLKIEASARCKILFDDATIC